MFLDGCSVLIVHTKNRKTVKKPGQRDDMWGEIRSRWNGWTLLLILGVHVWKFHTARVLHISFDRDCLHQTTVIYYVIKKRGKMPNILCPLQIDVVSFRTISTAPDTTKKCTTLISAHENGYFLSLLHSGLSSLQGQIETFRTRRARPGVEP